MENIALTYGVVNYLFQKKRRNDLSSQHLINLRTNDIILPKQEINNESFNEFQTEDKKGILGIVTKGKYLFYGIGKSNSKCLIETKEDKILVYSKGDYDVKINSPNIKKIKLKSKNNLLLTICYWNYPINEISNIISKYFMDDKIIKIINLTDNLDENWNDILSISLNNSVYNNDFSNPKIEIVSQNYKKDISEISNKYNFMIILNNFKRNKMEITDDPLLISVISQQHQTLEFKEENLLIWIMKYVEQFTVSSGKFFEYYQDLVADNEKNKFIDYIIAHKIASLYLKVDSEDEINLVDTLNNIIDSTDNTNILIKKAIIKYGLVNDSNNSYNYYNYNYNYNYYNYY